MELGGKNEHLRLLFLNCSESSIILTNIRGILVSDSYENLRMFTLQRVAIDICTIKDHVTKFGCRCLQQRAQVLYGLSLAFHVEEKVT